MRERRKDNVTMPPPSQLLLADTEVAALLGIGVSTVWKKAKNPEDGFPQPFNITDRAKRWRRSDVVECQELREARTVCGRIKSPANWRGLL